MKHRPVILSTLMTITSTVCGAPAQDKVPATPEQQGIPSDTPDRPGRNPAADPNRPGSGSGPAPNPVPAPADQTDFIHQAASGGAGELRLAQLGVTKAQDEKVKECARMLVNDYTATNQELKALAERLKITLEPAADPQLERTREELSRKSGKDFDKAFLQEMAACHRKAITLFEGGKKVAEAEEVKAFIQKALPVLKTRAEKIAEIGGWETGLPGPRPKPVVDPVPDSGAGRPDGPPQKPEPNRL